MKISNIFFQSSITLYGIDSVKIYAREIVAHPGSSINFTAPHRHAFKGPAGTGSNGLNGDKGVKGSTSKSIFLRKKDIADTKEGLKKYWDKWVRKL